MNAPTNVAALAPTVKLLIGGQFVESKTTEWREVIYPATLEVLARVPFATVAEVDAATPGMDLDDEPPLDEDYIEPDMDSAYSYLDDLASEHTAEPAPEPEPEPAAAPAGSAGMPPSPALMRCLPSTLASN